MLYKMQLALDFVENTRETARTEMRIKIDIDLIQCVFTPVVWFILGKGEKQSYKYRVIQPYR